MSLYVCNIQSEGQEPLVLPTINWQELAEHNADDKPATNDEDGPLLPPVWKF